MKMKKWRLTHDTVHDIFYITNLSLEIESFETLKPQIELLDYSIVKLNEMKKQNKFLELD
jgi:hypothetical protein